MIAFFANIFGYLLNFLYNSFNNYGVAIITFSIIVKAILLPISIKQQKNMKKSNKVQEEVKKIQDKYKNDQAKMNEELMSYYKKENFSPFSGCLSAIIQIVLLFAVFYLVRSPLTYMKKVDSQIIEDYKTKIQEIESETGVKTNYPEITIIKEFGKTDENVNINMNLLSLDLSSSPMQNIKDVKSLIIPILYVLSSIASMRLTTNLQKNKEKNIDRNTEMKSEDTNNKKQEDPMVEANKMMSLMMPVMSISIAMVAPIGLALYWFINNILAILERLILNKFFQKNEEEL